MKKVLAISAVILSATLLSGCSLNSADNTVKKPAGNIWKSVDGGKNWEVSGESTDKLNLQAIDVLSIAVNPFDGKNIFLGLRSGGILKSEDGGSTWDHLNYQSEKVYGLAIDHSDGRILYASGVWQKRGKIFKSLDLGRSWEEIYTAPSAGPLVIALTMDKRNARVLYASTSDNQVIKTEDGGQTWKNIFTAPAPVTQIAIDSGNSNLVYYNVMGRGIFRSRSGGENAEDIGGKLSAATAGNQSVGMIEADPTNSGWLYAAGGIGIARSKDAGNSWERIEILNNAQNFPVKALAINPSNSKEIIYGAAQAAYKSNDGGATWTTFQFESSKNVNVLKYNPAEAGTVYLGFGSK